MDFTSHVKLARRAADFAQQARKDDNGAGSDFQDYNVIAISIVAVTALVYYFALFKIRYMIGGVIGTLAIVEESESNMLVEVESSDESGLDKKDTDLLLEPEVAVVKVKPVTAKLRTAAAHLKANFGRRAAFRGLSLFAVTTILKAILFMPLASVLTGQSAAIGVIAADVALAKFEMVWVHHIISATGSESSWIRRKDSFAVPWVKIAPAALLKAATFQLAIQLPTLMYCAYPAMHNLAHGADGQDGWKQIELGAWMMAGSFVACLALIVLVYVPASVTFVRVAASLLPEQNRTIVSFDRTFGDRIAPGDSIGLMAAWTTFNWEQRRRYMALWGKVFAMMVALTIVFAGIGAVEISFLGGLPDMAMLAGQN